MGTDLLIVGGGIAGLSTAFWAACRDARAVTLVERGSRLGAEATQQNAAILRSQASDAVTMALGIRGGDLLREPPLELGDESFVDARGLVLTGTGASAARLERQFARFPETLLAHRLDAHEVADRVPYLRAPAELGLLFPGDGEIDVPRLVRALAGALQSGGADLRLGSGVRRLLRDGDRIRGVELEDGNTLEAQQTVLAAGAWAGILGARAGSRVRLRPTRRHLLVTGPSVAITPEWPAVWLEDRRAYARPEAGGLLLCACDSDDWPHPDRLTPRAEEAGRIVETGVRCFAGLSLDPPQRFWAGLRTFAPDKRFLVGPDPDLAGLYWVAGLGGHGMGTGLEVGRLAAAGLAGEDEDPLLAELDPSRGQPPRRYSAR